LAVFFATGFFLTDKARARTELFLATFFFTTLAFALGLAFALLAAFLTAGFLQPHWFIEGIQAVREWWDEFNQSHIPNKMCHSDQSTLSHNEDKQQISSTICENSLDAYHSRKNTGSLRTLILREGKRSGDRMVNLTVSGNPKYALKKHHLESFIAFLRAAIEPDDPTQKLCIFLTIQQIQKGSPTNFFEMHLYGPDHIREILHIKTNNMNKPIPLKFCISPSAFFQPNTTQAERLYSKALSMVSIPEQAVVYDLYCGTGALGICVANQVQQVLGIELSPESSLDARQNASKNALNNVTILTGSVQEKLKEIQQTKQNALSRNYYREIFEKRKWYWIF